ncbi:hypothetical protein OSB04_023336 [Centaurea solstitialis]|uniref:Structure-specific endonuclease subunit SLX1 homolog n=1 Tax=Centaurea solstitialis TaxID=347529 RepID=A0AA38SIY9_9ASTR|nr:hypothetical protein OSB04_023336 [Centaurea solstitialis]
MRKRKGPQSEITETLNNPKEDEDRNGRSKEDDLEDGQKSGFFACYLLTSLCPRFKGHTYIGFTVNPRRRIRQHNGEICSGASRTKKKRPWEMVFCIYGFPTNVAALQFEWAWQHPVESLAVRKAAVGFKSLGGLANKIKLAYTMLTLPAWNNLNLTVNFFSTKYTKHYAGCPSLPCHMRVQVRSMDELPCYTDGCTEEDDDMLRCENYSWDDDDGEEPERAVGSEAMLVDATIPVLGSKEATCVLDVEDHEQPSCSHDSRGWLFSNTTPERLKDDHLSSVAPVATGATKPVIVSEETTCVIDVEDDEQPSCRNGSARWLFSNNNTPERLTDDLSGVARLVTTDATKPVLVLDIEELEQPSCSGDSPGWLFSNTLERQADGLLSGGVAPTTTVEDENAKMDCGTGTKISDSRSKVEVIDLFTPSPAVRKKSKSRISGVCPETIDLTQSPIYV